MASLPPAPGRPARGLVRDAEAQEVSTDGERPLAPDEVLLQLPRGFGPFAVIFWAVASAIGLAWFLADPSGFWVLAGSLACLTVSIPFIVGKFDVVSPWTLVVVAIYISAGIRGFAIAVNLNGTRTVDELFVRGHPIEYFYRPTALYLLALALFTVGYLVAAARKTRTKRPLLGGAPHLSPEKVAIAVVVCAVLGMIGFFLFAESTGGLSLARISAKRTVINGLNLSQSYQSHGEFRVLNQFAPIALWLQVAYYAYRKVPHGMFTVRGVWLFALFLNAAALPVFASSRADIVYILIGAVLAEYCLGGQRLRIGPIVGTVLVVAVISTAISSLRYSDDTTVGGVSIDTNELVDTFVLTRTFSDFATSSNVINAVPNRLPYANGDTITSWLFAPIPRRLWPDKPIISAGPILGNVIYGNVRSGVPPGMIAESYWNFGLFGLLTLPLLCGLVMRRLSDYWRPFAKASPSAAILTGVVCVHPAVDLMTNSIGAGPYQVLLLLVLLLPVLWFVGSKHPPTNRLGAAKYTIAPPATAGQRR